MLYQQCLSLKDEKLPAISNLCNLLAVLYHELDHINWAGLYLMEKDGSGLYLGPFQGRPACTRIPVGRGVVGTCALRKEMLCVPDVCQFDGHIACDSRSRSEAVFPLMDSGKLLGVLDLDSDQLNRFDPDSLHALADVAGLLSQELARMQTDAGF